ncbi:cilia- and flagella-associated protein 46 isoform X3 [Oryzias melastigma]|uniref:cilia- and flagella-associated protein 46 isoform X3 n=1 Tax=Oryzias melastigma TaxID=30732 RepID=UPI000CF82D4E|nr:cilia- and flagella-associated protein 46 isoform X3 [Oryzias melastigma]
MELDIRHHLSEAKQNRDPAALREAFRLLTSDGAAAEHRRKTPAVLPELYVVCAETAHELGCVEMSTECLQRFFDGNPPPGQFLSRAFLCQGQMKPLPAAGSVEGAEEAVMCFLKAIEISKMEARCHFLVFNASVLYCQKVRPLLQPGRFHLLVPSLKVVVQSLEEVDDEDHSWRAELMILLVECFVDSGQRGDAVVSARATEEFITSHAPHLYPKLFILQVRHKLSEGDALLDMSRRSASLAVIYQMQELRRRIEMNENKVSQEDVETFENIFCLLVDGSEAPTSRGQSPPPARPSDRGASLLELAVLALQAKHQKVAEECLKELKSAGEANIDHRLMMECVDSEISLLNKEAKMDSKGCIEARLKEVEKLSQCLQTAVRAGSPKAVQAVCGALWNCCLPLLQHPLRTRIKAPLLTLAHVLEDMHSVLLEVRCHVHAELAVIEDEEGCLEASLTHLQKAMLLDSGAQRERLSSAFHLLQLRQNIYSEPTRTEEKAAALLQQTMDMPPHVNSNCRPVLVSVGLLLAPDEFQTLLDAESTLEFESGAQLAAKAQHHSACVQKAVRHLGRRSSDPESIERVKLWAALAKTARKQEVWDVCRAACRFCLLYDDGRWETSVTNGPESDAAGLQSCGPSLTSANRLQLLAEIHFISAEATIQKLLAEGVQQNSLAVPSLERRPGVSEEDWTAYRDWIHSLSAYATSSFMRAGELGAEIGEPWVVANAAIYLWNHNSHLLAKGEYQLLLPTFQSLLDRLQHTQEVGNSTLCVLLCDAVSRGLIQPISERDSAEPAPTGLKGKNRAEKRSERAASTHGASVEPAALQDVYKALELCDLALSMSKITQEAVPLAVRKRVLATWVQIKMLLQQQIDLKMDTLQDKREEVSAMTCVLVGVEMLTWNKSPGHTGFPVPSPSALVSMASECSWCDAVVELQVWCQLAAFCHRVNDHRSVLRCTLSALQLEEVAAHSLNTTPCVLFAPAAVKELLSSAACLRGLSLLHECRGDLSAYRQALQVLLSSVSFAKEAENGVLCVWAAGHYWSASLALTQNPEERLQLREDLEMVLDALFHISRCERGQRQRLATEEARSCEFSTHNSKTEDQALSLRAAISRCLLQLHIDEADFEGALKLLDKALTAMPRTRHRVPLLKCRVVVKTRLGQSVELDMQKLLEEGQQCCSFMWHQAALSAESVDQQLEFYQKAITSLTSSESRWQKVTLLLEFGSWLYWHNFPKADALQPVEWAIDLLLQPEPGPEEAPAPPPEEMGKNPESAVTRESVLGVQGSSIESLSGLKEVRRLDGLIQAHTLLAVMSGMNSHEHQLHLLRAHTFVLQVWQVSMAGMSDISREKNQLHPPPSAGSKKGRDKDRKTKDLHSTEDKPQPSSLEKTVPSTPSEWVSFVCPDQARQIFRTSSSPHCINAHSIAKQTQSLFYLHLLDTELQALSLQLHTLPVLHLAEIIAHDLLERRELSDVYRLRIVRTCAQLGFDFHSPYQEELLTLTSVQEQEQMESHKATRLSGHKKSLHRAQNQENKALKRPVTLRHIRDVSAVDVWLDKADVCLSLRLYPSARQLLTEAHMLARKLGDENAVSRSLLGLACLACEEQNPAQALILLDEAQKLGGNEDFWFQLIQTRVTAVVAQRDRDSQTKVDEVIKAGCEALELRMSEKANRVSELKFKINSLEKRAAVEYIHAAAVVKPGGAFNSEHIWKLVSSCELLRKCASTFTELGRKEQAAEAHRESARGLRLLAACSSDSDEQQLFLLSSFSQMQLAVMLQEQVLLNTRSQLTPHERHEVSLAAMRKLLRLRLTLAEFCLDVLEERCALEACQALARAKKTPAEVALEEFTRLSPEPNSVQHEWLSVSRSLGQAALGQLAAVSAHSAADSVEIAARSLSLWGKFLGLLAATEEPTCLHALWEEQKTEAWCDPQAVCPERDDSGKDCDLSRADLRMNSGRGAELQRRPGVQKVLHEANKVLSEAVNLCLQHRLPVSTLADASLNMLKCNGRCDSAVAGQCLALFQSCCAAAATVEVLGSARIGSFQLPVPLGIRSDLLLSKEERPSSMLKGADASLSTASKAFSHMTVMSNHLSILSELPPGLHILLLQHSQSRSELFGAFYKPSAASEQTEGKTSHESGTLTCTRVARVSVCPQALQALREKARLFSQRSQHSPVKEECRGGAEARLQSAAADSQSAVLFREVVQDMEDYLNPLLTQFSFSCLSRPPASPFQGSERTKDEEDEASTAEPGEGLVMLADRDLLELPLESLSILQEEDLSFVSRDFSLQFFYSRLNSNKTQKVESDNKKDTKVSKGAKGKAHQSQAIKATPVGPVQPSLTIPVDKQDFCYFADSEGQRSLSLMKEVLQTHMPHFTRLWGGSSVSESERVLRRCSAFVYMGKERFVGILPPERLAALNLSDCRLALLFDLVHSKADVHSQSNHGPHKSVPWLATQKPVETALWLSLSGISCVVLHQWACSPQQNALTAAAVLDDLLRVRKSSGQTIHSLRGGIPSAESQHRNTGLCDTGTSNNSKDDKRQRSSSPSAYNCILYGLPNLTVT